MKLSLVGVSLIELLVCFCISMLLIGILSAHLFSMTKQYHSMHQALDEVMELQWVFDFMRKKIRHAGFTPCRELNQLDVVDTRDMPEALHAVAIMKTPVPALLIQKMDETHFGRVKRLAPDKLYMPRGQIASGRPILIADCEHAEIHHAEKRGQVIQLKKPLVFDYEDEIYAGEFVTEQFFFRPHRGLLFKRHRADYLCPAKKVQFQLDDRTLQMKLLSIHDKWYHLKETMRMPC